MKRSLQKFSEELDRRVAEYQKECLLRELDRLIALMNEDFNSDEEMPEEIKQYFTSKLHAMKLQS